MVKAYHNLSYVVKAVQGNICREAEKIGGWEENS
jgi:hypothetical protein